MPACTNKSLPAPPMPDTAHPARLTPRAYLSHPELTIRRHGGQGACAATGENCDNPRYPINRNTSNHDSQGLMPWAG